MPLWVGSMAPAVIALPVGMVVTFMVAAPRERLRTVHQVKGRHAKRLRVSNHI